MSGPYILSLSYSIAGKITGKTLSGKAEISLDISDTILGPLCTAIGNELKRLNLVRQDVGVYATLRDTTIVINMDATEQVDSVLIYNLDIGTQIDCMGIFDITYYVDKGDVAFDGIKLQTWNKLSLL
jgi:hypothetical protein